MGTNSRANVTTNKHSGPESRFLHCRIIFRGLVAHVVKNVRALPGGRCRCRRPRGSPSARPPPSPRSRPSRGRPRPRASSVRCSHTLAEELIQRFEIRRDGGQEMISEVRTLEIHICCVLHSFPKFRSFCVCIVYCVFQDCLCPRGALHLEPPEHASIPNMGYSRIPNVG